MRPKDDRMTLTERLRNPAWITYVDGTSDDVRLHVEYSRAVMDEAAVEIERLRAALDLRNQEVVMALWLGRPSP